MFSGYKLTEMEKKIEELYKEKNILTTSDLKIHNVAELFNVKLDFSISGGPQRVIWEDDFSVIFLDSNETEENQRKVFFHELAHPILHCGDQTKDMNKKFRELQEAQANQFQLYAAMPFFMLSSLELPKYEYQMVVLIKNVFKVPSSLAKKRLEQIKRRILQTKIENGLYLLDEVEECAETHEPYQVSESFPLLEDHFSPNEIKSFMTSKVNKKPKVYYDLFQGKLLPIWYCIEFNRSEVNWGEKRKFFSIETEVEFLPINEFENKEIDAPVFAELMLHHSYPNDFAIDLKYLKKKLMFFDKDPYNVRRFVIDAKRLEELLQLNIFSSPLKHYQQLTDNTLINLSL